MTGQVQALPHSAWRAALGRSSRMYCPTRRGHHWQWTRHAASSWPGEPLARVRPAAQATKHNSTCHSNMIGGRRCRGPADLDALRPVVMRWSGLPAPRAWNDASALLTDVGQTPASQVQSSGCVRQGLAAGKGGCEAGTFRPRLPLNTGKLDKGTKRQPQRKQRRDIVAVGCRMPE